MKGRLKWKARVDLCIRQDLQTSITLKFMLTIVFLEIIMLFLSSPPLHFFLSPADPLVIGDGLNATGTSSSDHLICRVSVSQLLGLH